ncbi:amidohydrolase family protein [Thermodesulfobacteriota bacterium]
MIIDLEHHLYLETELQKGSSKSGRICERYWDSDGELRTRTFQEASHVDRYLQFMDEAGIDVAVVTTNAIATLEQCKRWNDFCAKVVNEIPKRFVGFASIPPLGGRLALEELERAVKELGLKGVHIRTQTEGHALDSRELWPFYEKVSELGIPVDVHITREPSGFDFHAPYALYYLMAREFDMCVATFRICLGGVLEDFPHLVFIMNHFAGGISAVMDRIDPYMSHVGPGWPDFYLGKPLITKPWREYFNKLYFSMAGREAGIAAVKCALTNISPRKLMFGTDWPYDYDGNPQDVKRYVEQIRKLDLPKDEIEAMLGGNAAKLLGIEAV